MWINRSNCFKKLWELAIMFAVLEEGHLTTNVFIL